MKSLFLEKRRLKHKMGKEIKYLGFYDKLYNGKLIRTFSLAAAKKMDYLCAVLGKMDYNVEIISASHITGQCEKYQKETRVKVNAHTELVLPPSMGAKNKVIRIARVFLARLWLFGYLLKNCKKNEKLLVYHNYAYAIPLLIAQKIKGFEIVLEVEEQYSMVWKLTSYQKWKEKLLLKRGGRGSLVVSELLAKKLNIENPIVSYGNYSSYNGDIAPKGLKKEINLIYTGSIDKVKGSAFLALETMKYLPENYQLRLSGPVANNDKQLFEKKLREINIACGREAVIYMGLLNDSQYEKLLLSADIALNPQQDGDFGMFLFPSKILTYLAYDLPVVSTKGASIVQSGVAKLIDFAEEFTPESVAIAVKEVNFSDRMNSRKQLDIMSQQFKEKLMKRLENDT